MVVIASITVDKHFATENWETRQYGFITVKLPKENIVQGSTSFFSVWEGININEVISTSNEFTILVSEEQVDVALKYLDLKN
jgi:hypothetical protein